MRILKWDGASWSAKPIPGVTNDLNGIWGKDANSIWVVGSGGIILKWDGSSWAVLTSGFANVLYSVFGFDDTNVWAGGEFGTILRWNGLTWVPQTSGISVGTVTRLWGSDTKTLWAVVSAASGTIV